MRELFYDRNPGDANRIGSGVRVAPASPNSGPQKNLTDRLDLVAQRAPNAMVNVISAERNGKRPPSTIVFLAQVLGFLYTIFCTWAPKIIPQATRARVLPEQRKTVKKLRQPTEKY